MFWENVKGCATVCRDCGQSAFSYLNDEGELLAKLFNLVYMKNPVFIRYYAEEAERQTKINKAFFENDYNEKNVFWFRELICEDCLKKCLTEKDLESVSPFDEDREEYVYNDVLVARDGNILVDFVDFVGYYQEQLHLVMDDLVNKALEQLTLERLNKLTGKAFHILKESNCYGIKKEKYRIIERYSYQALRYFERYLNKALKNNDVYKQIKTDRQIMYEEINKKIDLYPDSLIGYYAEENLSYIKIGCFIETDFLSFGIHLAEEIYNPKGIIFFSGLYETNLPYVKEIVHEQPELIYKWDSDSKEIFRKRLVRKVQRMGFL